MGICREYILGLQMELARKELPRRTVDDQVKLLYCSSILYSIYCSIYRSSIVDTLPSFLFGWEIKEWLLSTWRLIYI